MRAARKGFTLVEMLVVIGIIILFASITIVAFTPFFRGRSLDTGALRVKTALLAARTYAVNNRCPVYLFKFNDHALRMYADSAGTTSVAEPVNLPRNVTIDDLVPVPPAPAALAVTATGSMTSGSPAEVVLRGPNASKTIYILWSSCIAYTEE